MEYFQKPAQTIEQEMLIAFFDLTGFARFSKKLSAKEVFNLMSNFYELVGDIVESAGGIVVKFIGDAGLLAFPATRIDEGVIALYDLKEKGDTWLSEKGFNSKNIIKAHFGSVVCGPIGTKSEKRFDVFGQTVNTASVLKSNGLALSQQVFRKLKPNTRKLFKKHTPPITYIPLNEVHRD